MLKIENNGKTDGMRTLGNGWRAGLLYVSIFIALAVGIVTVAAIYFRHFAERYRAQVEGQISIIAELKVFDLVQYRRARMGDAAILFKNEAFSSDVRRFFTKSADTDARRRLQNWLGKYEFLKDYDEVRLLDTQGVMRLSVPDRLEPVSPGIVQASADAIRSGQVAFQDFYRQDYDQRIYLAVLAPIFDEIGGGAPLGTVVLRIDPTTYLYPFIQSWPGPSRTAETLMVRREGNEAVYLNDLKFSPDAALNLRAALTNTHVPAVRGVLGREGIMEGRDYRGVVVIADARRVPESPWFLVARMDKSEVYAPLREKLLTVVILIAGLLFGAGAWVALVWRQERLRFYRERVQAVEERERLRAQLLQSQKLQSLGTLAGGVAHEINNPIMGIMGYAQLLLDRVGGDSKAAGFAAEIGKESRRISMIVKNLLVFARDGKELQCPAHMRGIVEDTLSLIRTGMLNEHIAVELNVPDDLPSIKCCSRQIQQVIMNLLTNARDALNEKYPGRDADKKIMVSAEVGIRNAEGKWERGSRSAEVGTGKEISSPEVHVRLTVEDHGPGIAEDLREQIFEPFLTTKQPNKGMGLGLSISHSIAKDHGGTLSVESEFGKWTRFHLDLPVE